MSDFIYLEPRHKMITNKANTKLICESQYIYLMCPECLNMTLTSISINSLATGINDTIKDFDITNSYYGTCPDCKEPVEFVTIDGNMGEIIKILNDKGYYTAYCCEGHIEQDCDLKDVFMHPYIYFYFWKDTEVLKTNPLPDTWYIEDIDKECHIFTICDNINTIVPESIKTGNEIHDVHEYIDWIKNNWDKKKRLQDICNWAIGLPNKSEDDKKALRDIAKKCRESILEKNSNKIVKYYEKQ
jgi:hypothetical protein